MWYKISLALLYVILIIYAFYLFNMVRKLNKTKKNNKKSVNENTKPIRAIAVFQPEVNTNISGSTIFEELGDKVKVTVKLTGLKPGKHGFHVHETGNILEKCMACKAHFNPFNTEHGGQEDDKDHRHVGDFGNVVANDKGEVDMTFEDSLITLRGTKCNIIGRSLVIHEKEDDLGRTPNNPESKINGLAGARLGCAVIGYMDAYYF